MLPILSGGFINLDQYVTLPQNLLTSPGTLLEDFEISADWTPNAHASVAANAVNYKTGTYSEKMTDIDTNQAAMEKTVNLDMSGSWEKLVVWFYMHDVIADYGSNSVQLYLSNHITYANAFRKYITTGNLTHNQNLWTPLFSHKTEFETIGAGSWANPIIRIQLRFGGAAAGKTPAISFDSMYTGIRGIPAVCLTFDDGTIEQYNNCFTYMKPRGIRGTCYAISDYVDTANYMTHQQLQELDSYGWAIGNHTKAHVDLTTLTEAQQETAILTCTTALLGWSLSKGAYHLCLVQGASNANTRTAMTNLGILTARTARDWTGNAIRLALPFGDLWRIPSCTSTGHTLAELKVYIDTAITGGYVCTIHLHKVGAGDISTADFQALIDYIQLKSRAGLIYPITIDDLYKLTLGPVRVPKIK